MADYIDPKDEFYKNYFLNLAKSGQLDKPSITSNELSESNSEPKLSDIADASDYKVPVAEGDVLKKLEPYFEKAGSEVPYYAKNIAASGLSGLDALLAHIPSTGAKATAAAFMPGEEDYSEKYKKASELFDKRKEELLKQYDVASASNIGNMAGSFAGMGKFGKAAQAIGGGSKLAHAAGIVGYGGLEKASEAKELEEMPSKFLEGAEDFAKFEAAIAGLGLSYAAAQKLKELYKNPTTRKMALSTLGLSAATIGPELSTEE